MHHDANIDAARISTLARRKHVAPEPQALEQHAFDERDQRVGRAARAGELAGPLRALEQRGQRVERLFVRGASYADHASVAARAHIVSRVDLRARVRELACPVLLVVGSRDRFTGEASQRMAPMLSRASLVAIEGGGHLCHTTHPKPFLAAVLPFLAGAVTHAAE